MRVRMGVICGGVPVPGAALLGDVAAGGNVKSADVGQAKAKSGRTTDATNCRTDVTVNGVINSSDVGVIKSQSGTMLPPSSP